MELLWTSLLLGLGAIAILVVAVIGKMLLKYRHLNKQIGTLPTENNFHFLFGNMKDFPGLNDDGLAFISNRCMEFPKLHVLWMGPFSAYVTLHHPETVKVILQTTEPKTRSAMGLYAMGLPWLGEGLLISDGEKWKRNRRLLTPAFHFDILRPYIAVYNSAVDILLEKFHRLIKDGASVDIFDHISLCTLDIILKCAFSSTDDIQNTGENNPYVHAVGILNELWMKRTLKPYLFTDFLYYLSSDGRKYKKYCDYVHEVAEDIIKKRQNTLEKEGVPQNRCLDFLDILITAKDEDGNGLSLLEMRNEVDTFLFEGHDTTASSISWTLYSLAAHPDIQERVHEELEDVLANKDYVDWNETKQLEYLTCCIKESMRLHVPVQFIQRQTTKELIIDEHKIPAGIPISIQIYALHHNPHIWDEPMEYRPDRFNPENSAKRDSFAFIPFSAGPRNCIGQHLAMDEQKVVIARVVSRYRLSLDPSHEAKKKMRLVMKSQSGIWLYLTPR